MKVKLIVSIIAFLNSILFSFADQPGSAEIKNEKCGTVRHTEYLKSKEPSLQRQITQDENILQQALNNSSIARISNTVYTLPVVVHVVYYTSGQNISDAQIQSQIDVLNEDYSRTNADTSNTPSPFLSFASSTNFQFCLARRDPNGALTNGIERRQTMVQVFQSDDNVKFYSSGGLDAWDVNKYLNIWVCDLDGQVIGYGEQPSSIHTNSFGVVIKYNTFGRTGIVINPYQFGRTCTHELGHCLNLYHIWGDEDGCTGTDFINDTPNQAKATYGCHSFPYADICTINYPGIMFMNYMDYSDDDCMNMFTKDQATRMFTSINSYYPTLLISNGCLANGIESLSDFKFSVYPNPTSGILDIDMFTTQNIGSKANIRITDVLGKVVHESVILNPNGFVHRLDLQHLNDGIYFLTVYINNCMRTEKILLTH